MIHVGFTGTRHGMTPDQKMTVATLLSGGADFFHHGDCVGADAEAHTIARSLVPTIVVHPPEDPKMRAWTEGDVTLAPLTYLARNREIVDTANLLIAAPLDYTEQPSGGTWYTVRYARKQETPVLIVWPDGSMESS